MQILITNDDGPDCPGLAILREAALTQWPSAMFTTLVPKAPQPGMSMARSLRDPTTITLQELIKVDGDDAYRLNGTPLDCVLLAFYRTDLFLPGGNTFDLVLAGVNAGKNVGLDVYTSGTVGQAMFAASAFGTTGFAFSQEIEGQNPSAHEGFTRKDFVTAEKVLPRMFQNLAIEEGTCWNVNFPAGDPKGIELDPIAHYSGWWTPTTNMIPRARQEKSDVKSLEAGYVSMARVMLRVNPPMRF